MNLLIKIWATESLVSPFLGSGSGRFRECLGEVRWLLKDY